MQIFPQETAAGICIPPHPCKSKDVKHKATILVVDDVTAVRQLCRAILEHAGYQVVEAGSAESARTVWEEHANNIDLLVTDYEMPGDNGLQLAEYLHSRRPSLPAIMVSGSLFEDLKLPPYIAFLEKPFNLKALLEVVRFQLQDA